MPGRAAARVRRRDAVSRTRDPDRPRGGRSRLRRLDDLPLAIELAARTRVLSPVQLLERLDARLPLLTSGRRDAPERQQTLGATVAWSYELLRPAEQRLFARLAVFRGGFTVEAAEQVCEAALDALDGLVEQSLARRAPDGRLGMLETVREFASEQLEASGELDRMHRRHADWCLALVRSANLSSDASAERRPDRVLPEQDNLRAALTWSRDAGERKLGLEIVLGLVSSGTSAARSELASWLETFARNRMPYRSASAPACSGWAAQRPR